MIDTAALWIGYAFMVGAVVCALIEMIERLRAAQEKK